MRPDVDITGGVQYGYGRRRDLINENKEIGETMTRARHKIRVNKPKEKDT